MNVEIRRLSPDLVDDYTDYFMNVAFADHEEWAGCCCLHFHWSKQVAHEHQEFVKTAKRGDFSFNLRYATHFVKDGTIQGYLAYLDGRVVGWCNANDKANYAVLEPDVSPDIWEDDKKAKVKSVVCFSIAPDMRGQGIATQLLQRVCEDAKEQGYDYVEAYPQRDCEDLYMNHHGPIGLYLKQGFILQKELATQVIMRKRLH